MEISLSILPSVLLVTPMEKKMMMERKLFDAASTQDVQEQQQLVQELIHYFRRTETFPALVETLSASDETTRRIALRIVENIGYPQNALVVPTLLEWVAYGDSIASRTQEALSALIHIGPPILAQLVPMIEADSSMDNLVGATLDKIAHLFWTRLDDEGDLFDVIVRELARYPDDVLDFLVYVLRDCYKNWWGIAAQAIATIGYPRNASAITTLLRLASDMNAPGEKQAANYLLSLDVHVLVPYFIEVLLTPEDEDLYASWEDVYFALRHLDRHYLLTCGPLLAYLLSFQKALPSYKVHTFFDLLERIGPECAIYALPSLLELLRREGNTDIGQRAWRLVNTFDPQILAPYALVLASLRLSTSVE